MQRRRERYATTRSETFDHRPCVLENGPPADNQNSVGRTVKGPSNQFSPVRWLRASRGQPTQDSSGAAECDRFLATVRRQPTRIERRHRHLRIAPSHHD
jgi:hypothetical protein